MKVEFVNNDGGGFADLVDVEKYTTLGEFVKSQVPNIDVNKYRVKVNGQVERSNYELRQGDKVSLTPLNIKGA